MKLILKGNESSPQDHPASKQDVVTSTLPTASDVLASVFEERAENLSKSELETWTAYTPTDSALIAKLMGPGAKLLIGPRGSGKSTLLRTAYFRLLHGSDALAVYVNYARSLALEPLFHKRANALQVFRQWLLMKIVLGVETSLRDLQQNLQADFSRLSATANILVRQLETGLAPDAIDEPLAPSQLTQLLEQWADGLARKRIVLLFDDAAHAFSLEQQREFFEVFRELRSRRVSGKAAVYPGITSYSPYFHVGHEAELLEAWYRPEDSVYLPIMRQIVDRRLPVSLRSQLADRQELVDYLALAAFGLPRGFLNMLSQLFAIEENIAARPTRQRTERAVTDHAESVRGIFKALSGKLPRFRHFVEVGEELETAIIKTLRKYNRLQPTPAKKATVVAIKEPLGKEMERMLNMLEYAGIVRRLGTVSRGVKGRFQRYSVHHAILLAENALSLGKSYPMVHVIQALSSRGAHAFARTKPSTLLGHGFQARCTLDLPPCPRCKTSRLSEDQRFCMKCGAQLTDASVYEELLQAPIERLPLTSKKIHGIKQYTSLRTIHEVLLDDEGQSIRRVPYIGPIWAAKIRTYAEEFVSV